MKREQTEISKIEMFDALMESIPDSIYFMDLNSRFIKVSKSLIERRGVNNPDEILGKTNFDFYTKELASKIFRDEQNIIKTGVPLMKIEEKIIREGREERWHSATKLPLYDKKEKNYWNIWDCAGYYGY